jgi:hypothetical protein
MVIVWGEAEIFAAAAAVSAAYFATPYGQKALETLGKAVYDAFYASRDSCGLSNRDKARDNSGDNSNMGGEDPDPNKGKKTKNEKERDQRKQDRDKAKKGSGRGGKDNLPQGGDPYDIWQ